MHHSPASGWAAAAPGRWQAAGQPACSAQQESARWRMTNHGCSAPCRPASCPLPAALAALNSTAMLHGLEPGIHGTRARRVGRRPQSSAKGVCDAGSSCLCQARGAPADSSLRRQPAHSSKTQPCGRAGRSCWRRHDGCRARGGLSAHLDSARRSWKAAYAMTPAQAVAMGRDHPAELVPCMDAGVVAGCRGALGRLCRCRLPAAKPTG